MSESVYIKNVTWQRKKKESEIKRRIMLISHDTMPRVGASMAWLCWGEHDKRKLRGRYNQFCIVCTETVIEKKLTSKSGALIRSVKKNKCLYTQGHQRKQQSVNFAAPNREDISLSLCQHQQKAFRCCASPVHCYHYWLLILGKIIPHPN